MLLSIHHLVAERLLRVARSVQACPAHQYVRPAIAHLKL